MERVMQVVDQDTAEILTGKFFHTNFGHRADKDQLYIWYTVSIDDNNNFK